MGLPLLAEFAIRLAGGMTASMLALSWREVPLRYFRTHCLILLGLWVLAALDLGRVDGGALPTALAVVGSVFAFLAGISWGLGLPGLATPTTVALTVLAAVGLAAPSLGFGDPQGLLDVAGRLSSALLLGTTLSAMLLGHHYLTAPAMSIEPLKRLVGLMGWSLGLRALLALIGLLAWTASDGGSTPAGSLVPLFLGMRWGMGLAAPMVATVLAWKTAAIRSTQSATGILYAAATLVLLGEVTSLVLARELGRSL